MKFSLNSGIISENTKGKAMKPSVKVIITGPSEIDVVEFVEVLSDTEITEHEKKVPNPFSATKEEALLLPLVGRAEWDNIVIQMQALAAHKRYDFAWSTLLRDVYGVIVLLDGDDPTQIDETHRLLKLFSMIEQTDCLVAIRQTAIDAQKQADIRAHLETDYTVISYVPYGKDGPEKVLRAWIDLVPPPEEPTRRRTRTSSKKE
jgi:signal recognition particle receptor subunit beta